MPQKKHLSQVFLHDHNIINKIIAKSPIDPTSPIIEIGCGKGILSLKLAQRCEEMGQELVIVEVDEEWIKYTKEVLKSYNHVRFIHASFLDECIYDQLPKRFQVIANIPYRITSDILEQLIYLKARLVSATLMIQDDVARKWVALPKKTASKPKIYMSQSLFCQYHFKANILFDIAKTCYYPQPKVDSSMIHLAPFKHELSKDLEDLLFKIIKAGFWGRRKTLKSCLSRSPHLKLDSKALQSHNLAPTLAPFLEKRAEMLSLDEFIQLATHLHKANAIT